MIDEDITEESEAEWGVGTTKDTPDGDQLAAEWEASLSDNLTDEVFSATGEASERILSQDEIDSLLGFSLDDPDDAESVGIKALLNSTLVSYERLPMMEVVFDRLVRLLTTSLRNFTSDNVEVSLDSISSIRFGDYLNSIPLPAILAVFRAKQLDNYGLITVDSNLIYSIIDILLGGRRGYMSLRVEGRPYTTIERTLVMSLIEVILSDAKQAFAPLTELDFDLDRIETNPRFAAISRPANAAILVQLRIDMEDRGGRAELLLPYATLEPVRKMLLQNFMGEKFGRDNIWESHLATELWASYLPVQVVLDELKLPLKRMLELKEGETIFLNAAPDSQVQIRSGDLHLTHGRMGRLGRKVAVKLEAPLKRAAQKAIAGQV